MPKSRSINLVRSIRKPSFDACASLFIAAASRIWSSVLVPGLLAHRVYLIQPNLVRFLTTWRHIFETFVAIYIR